MRRLLALVVLVGAAVFAGTTLGEPASPTVEPATIAPKPKPPKRLARPPQFVVVSFDGAGGATLWRYWRSVAKRAHAHFSFFVSGVYLLDWARHDRYLPPAEPSGYSAIGFAPDRAWAAATRRQLALGYQEGNEIGTHYNGHFCGQGGVDSWSSVDWSQELDMFDWLLFGRGRKLPFGPGEVVGGRTPCLEGKLDVLYRLLARRGFRYDASRTASLGTWPTRRLGIWSVPLLELPFYGHTFNVVSMDYNFLANQGGLSHARIEEETYRTFWNAFRTTYHGNRAPLSLANHFETWEGWAYNHALTRFLLRACGLPEVRCTTIRALVDWLDRQSPRLNRS